ncbi:MAG TPA: type 4a pilus biogenesis protein PilO [Actinomycetota bacterium]|nr:type 4a pilus biogenesis protein PilO [Actinomycetota bacterium]
MNRRAPLIAGIAAFLVAVLVFVFLVFPKFGQIDEAEQDLREAEQQELALEAELARLRAAAEDLPRLQRQLARFRRAVPPVADLPGLINDLQDAANVAGVEFFSISPSQPVAGPGATEIPAQVQVIGTFFPVDEFLFRLETLRRAAEVDSIQVAEGPDSLPQIDVIMQVTFFTTDPTAGPGAGIEPPPVPGATPTPGASPTPGTTPSPATTPGG